jgi:hypothetical protein
MRDAGLRRVDQRRLQIAREEILCVACVRNEALRLQHFLDYHRRLGVHRFLIVDNASTDGTTDMLLSEPDVHVFVTRQRYSKSGQGRAWINGLLQSHASGHWTLTVDADELFVYPSCEAVDLSRVADYLDRRGEDAILTFLLDMYSEKPIRETAYVRGTSFLESCRYFDTDSYVWEPADLQAVPSAGGPRMRLFFPRRRPPAGTVGRLVARLRNRTRAGAAAAPPLLRKIPFVRWRDGLAYTSSTHALPGVRLGELTGVLMHFKFFADFPGRVAEEAARREHWQQACEYVVYRDVLAAQPDLALHYGGSACYEDSHQLGALGLVRRPKDFPAPPEAAGPAAPAAIRGGGSSSG